MKRNDIILLIGIGLLIMLSFLLFRPKKQDGTAVLVYVDGKEVCRFLLSEDRRERIEGVLGECYLVIQDRQAFLEESPCPDHYCEKQGKIRKEGEQIICLPNKIIIDMIGEKEEDIDMIVK